MGGSAKKFEKGAKKSWNTSVRNPVHDLGEKLNNFLGGGPNNDEDLTKKLEEEQKKKEDELKAVGPAPTPQEATTDLESRRRKALRLLRSGLMSTVRTGSRGVADSPSLLTPQAFAYGLKAKLGQ